MLYLMMDAGIYMTQERGQKRALFKTVINPQVPEKAEISCPGQQILTSVEELCSRKLLFNYMCFSFRVRPPGQHYNFSFRVRFVPPLYSQAEESLLVGCPSSIAYSTYQDFVPDLEVVFRIRGLRRSPSFKECHYYVNLRIYQSSHHTQRYFIRT